MTIVSMVVASRTPFSIPANDFADVIRMINIPFASMLIMMLIMELFRMHPDLLRRLTLISGIAFISSAVYAQVTYFGYPMTARTVLTFVGTVVGVTAGVIRLMDR